jgi:energy-coupling factor transport system permease protein
MGAKRSALHPVTWMVWAVVAAAAAVLTRNPLYLSILLGVAGIHYASGSQRRPEGRGWGSLLRLAAGLAILIVPFNALNVHAGSHVLFRLPLHWPLIGGPITLEAVLWGACTALGLLTLLTLFAAFNLSISQAQILRLTPAFLYEAGLIVSIALTFVPQMMSSAREIREAQRIRGHRMRRVRDMLPFLMALLTTGLERSFQLAESIEARGFGNVRDIPSRRDILFKALSLIGLGGALSSFFALTYLSSWRTIGWIAFVLSAGLLVAVFWAQGRYVVRTYYRRERWTWRDGLSVVACLVAVAALAWARIGGSAGLVYDPYQGLLPPFHSGMGLALVALVLPVLAGWHTATRPPVRDALREAPSRPPGEPEPVTTVDGVPAGDVQ